MGADLSGRKKWDTLSPNDYRSCDKLDAPATDP